MTSRSFADLTSCSPSGKLRLVALSPDNGNALLRDGRPVEGRTFGAFQRNFRYQLVDAQTEKVCWERWQGRGEGSPTGAFVSDEGHVVVRAATGDWACDQLLFLDASGRMRLVVIVAANDWSDDAGIGSTELEHGPRVWRDAHVRVTSGGPIWEPAAFETFCSVRGSTLFSLRTAWRRRLVVDLRSMEVLDDALPAQISAEIATTERQLALDALRASAAALANGDVDWHARNRVAGALAVVMDQRISEASPFLRLLERTSGDGAWQSCSVLGDSWNQHQHTTRALARLALRVVGEEPSTGGNYGFSINFPGSADDEAKTTASEAIPTPSTAWEKARATKIGSTAWSVLAEAGPPDFIHAESRQLEKYYVWSEIWDYDGPEASTRLVWDFPKSHKYASRPRRLVRIDEVEGWRGTGRLLSLLGWDVGD